MTTNIRKSSSIAYIPGLDGVRALAVSSVILFHYMMGFSDRLQPLGGAWRTLTQVASIGWVGVDVFFAISGFLITKLLMVSPISGASGYLDFLKRRALRLLPAYVICLAAVLVPLRLLDPSSRVLPNEYLLWTFTSNIEMLFVERPALSDNHVALFHFWTLAMEWQFYLLFPIIAAALRSLRRAALLLIAAAIVCRLAFYFGGISGVSIYAFPACRMDSLALGAIVATIPNDKWEIVRRPLSMFAPLMFVAMLLAITVSNEPFKTIIWLELIGYSAIGLVSAIGILSIATAAKEAWIVRALEIRTLTGIGRRSYSVYIWHLPLYPWIAGCSSRYIHDPRAAFLAASCAGLLTTALAAEASYRFIEYRFMKMRSGRRRFVTTEKT